MTCQSIPEAWKEKVLQFTPEGIMERLEQFLSDEENAGNCIYPPEHLRFTALAAVAPADVKVVVLGQDPYHDEGQAHGLAFSVPGHVKIPPSLKNIFKELAEDLDCLPPESGDLSSWARQGVLLLNTVLSVRAHEAGSHQNHGWEELTDAVIRAVALEPKPKVFVLWGAPAQKKRSFIDEKRDLVISSPHPSPLSAYRGFFGSRPFSKINDFLEKNGRNAIEWSNRDHKQASLEF